MPTLYKVSVPVSGDSEEATVEALEAMFQRTACVETDVEANTTHVSVFLEAAPSRPKLREILPRFSVRKLRQENWAESWKRHFKPMDIGSKLLIKPSWSRRKARAGQRLIVLDPGLSFGTGQHPTTRFCVEQVVRFRDEARKQSFLDVGTGSGILAIAAAKLGYSPVRAIDFDATAVRIAQANARRNRVKLQIKCIELSQHSAAKKCDLICANLLTDVLLAERDRLVNFMHPGARLVLAGILRLQFRDVQAAYEDAGLKLIASVAEKEWKSGAFEWRQNFPEK